METRKKVRNQYANLGQPDILLVKVRRHLLRDFKQSSRSHGATKLVHLYHTWLQLEKQKEQDPINNFKEWELGKRALWAAKAKTEKLSVLAIAQLRSVQRINQ